MEEFILYSSAEDFDRIRKFYGPGHLDPGIFVINGFELHLASMVRKR